MLTLLMFRGANVNATDRKDRRPLHYAGFMGKEFSVLASSFHCRRMCNNDSMFYRTS